MQRPPAMTHAIFEMDFELAAREVEDRVRPDRPWIGWHPPPALALRALRVMFQHRRDGAAGVAGAREAPAARPSRI